MQFIRQGSSVVFLPFYKSFADPSSWATSKAYAYAALALLADKTTIVRCVSPGTSLSSGNGPFEPSYGWGTGACVWDALSWQSNHLYVPGDFVTQGNGGQIAADGLYYCEIGGTSGPGGPAVYQPPPNPPPGNHTIKDGTVVWARVNTWQNSTIVTAGDYYVTSSGTLYVCSTATIGGTSSSSTGPNGTGTGIADGTASWSFVTATVPPQWEFVTTLGIVVAVYGLPNGKQITLGRIRVFAGHPRVPNPNTVVQDASAPSSGQWFPGDIVWNTALDSSIGNSPNAGWICTIAGSPGTWQPFGALGGKGTKYAGSSGLTSPIASAGSNDRGGTITFAGVVHKYSAGNALFTIDYGAHLPAASFVVVTAGNEATALLFNSIFTSGDKTQGTVRTAAAFTTGAVRYVFNYVVVGG